MAHEIFISYSSKDKTIADAVCSKLEDQNIRCWIAPRDVPAGQNFAESIIEAIDTCKAFVLIWSANTNASEHILNEINRAFDQGITIVPFRIQDVQPTRAMSYYFGRTHWLDALTPPLEKHIATLAATILTILGLKSESEPEVGPASKEPAQEGVKKSVKPAEAVEPGRQTKKLKVKTEGMPSQEPLTKKKGLIPALAGISIIVIMVILYALGIFERYSSATGLHGSSSSADSTMQIGMGAVTSISTPTVNKGVQDPQSGHWYRLTNISFATDDDNTVWKKENEYCRHLGGHLAIIESASENDFIYNNVYLEGHAGTLGATDKDEEGKWLWVTGEPMQYINWAAGEPDNFGGYSTDARLNADFLTFSDDDPSGKWRDVADAHSAYICEFDN